VLASTFPRWKDDVEPPFVYELCRRLSEHFAVYVLAPHAPGAELEELLDGIHVTRYRYFISPWQSLAYHGGILANLKQNPMRYALLPFFLIGQLIAFIRLLHRRRYACIHAHWLIPQGLTAIACRWIIKSPPPVIVTSHGGDLFGLKGRLLTRLKRYIVRQSTAVTVVSHAMQDAMRALDSQADHIRVIPMGVDLQHRFTPPVERQKTGVILFVGRLIEKKGLKYLIDAFPSILSKHPQVNLRIVGDGPEKERIKEQILDQNLSLRVEFNGALSNDVLPQIYRLADVVVFPSIIAGNRDREGFGLVLVEALGCGCAAVVTDLPAMRDIVEHGKSALVVPQKDSAQLAKKICDLLGDDKLRQTIGGQGRAYVLQKFDWEIISGHYKDLIHSVMK